MLVSASWPTSVTSISQSMDHLRHRRKPKCQNGRRPHKIVDDLYWCWTQAKRKKGKIKVFSKKISKTTKASIALLKTPRTQPKSLLTPLMISHSNTSITAVSFENNEQPFEFPSLRNIKLDWDQTKIIRKVSRLLFGKYAPSLICSF